MAYKSLSVWRRPSSALAVMPPCASYLTRRLTQLAEWKGKTAAQATTRKQKSMASERADVAMG